MGSEYLPLPSSQDLSTEWHVYQTHSARLWVPFLAAIGKPWLGASYLEERKWRFQGWETGWARIVSGQASRDDFARQDQVEAWSERRSVHLTSPTTMSQSSSSYLILAIRRDWNLNATAMQAIVKQTALAAMMLGAMSSVMCNSCSSISAGVGMEAILSVWEPSIVLHCAEEEYYCFSSLKRGKKQKRNCARSRHLRYLYKTRI